MNNPKVSKIRIYPVKSLDAIELNEAEIGIRSLRHDRTFAMMGEDGHYVNGKRTGKVNQLKATYELENELIHLTPLIGGSTETFELREGNISLNEYLEKFFEIPLRIVHSTKGELLDVPIESSATLISQASYDLLLEDFPNNTIDDFRLRFRANIEITGVEAFWEETLVQSNSLGMRVKIGDVEMICTGPRARCNVPPRNPLNGKLDKTFIKKMLDNRNRNLSDNSILHQQENLYYFAVDMLIPKSEVGKIIKVGDKIEVLNTVNLPAS